MNEYSYQEMEEICRTKLDNLVQAFHTAPTTNYFLVLNNEDQKPMKEAKSKLAELGRDNVFYLGTYENAGEVTGTNDMIRPIDDVPEVFWDKCLPIDRSVKKHITLITDIGQDPEKIRKNLLIFFHQLYQKCVRYLQESVKIDSIVTLNVVLALPESILPNNFGFSLDTGNPQANQANQDKYDAIKRALAVCTECFNQVFHSNAEYLDMMRFPDCGVILRQLNTEDKGISKFVNELYYLTVSSSLAIRGQSADLDKFKADDMPWLTYSTGLTDDTIVALMNAVVRHVEVLQQNGRDTFYPPAFSDFRNMMMIRLGYSPEQIKNGFKLDHEINDYKNYQPTRVMPNDVDPANEDRNAYWDNRFNQQQGNVANEGLVGATYIPTRTDHRKAPDADANTINNRARELYNRVDSREAMHLMLACSSNPLAVGMPMVNQQTAAQGITNCFRSFANATAANQPDPDLVFSSLMNIYADELADMQIFLRDYADMTERMRSMLTELRDNNLVPAKKYLSPDKDIFSNMHFTQLLSRKTLSVQFIEYLERLAKNRPAATAFTQGLDEIRKRQSNSVPDVGVPEFILPNVADGGTTVINGREPISYLSEKMYYKIAKIDSLSSLGRYYEAMYAINP